jgi:hypothetical protein
VLAKSDQSLAWASVAFACKILPSALDLVGLLSYPLLFRGTESRKPTMSLRFHQESMWPLRGLVILHMRVAMQWVLNTVVKVLMCNSDQSADP